MIAELQRSLLHAKIRCFQTKNVPPDSDRPTKISTTPTSVFLKQKLLSIGHSISCSSLQYTISSPSSSLSSSSSFYPLKK